MSDYYKAIYAYYDLLSRLYSMGQIPKCRKYGVDLYSEDYDRELSVCFAGVGHGSEALYLARKGALVTVVDTSASMLSSFQSKLEKETQDVKMRVCVIHGDIRDVEEQYDWVVANFFLNVFDKADMLIMLDSLTSLCNLNGNLIVGDFFYDKNAGVIVRLAQRLNWSVALCIFRLFVKNAKHSIYDYKEPLEKRRWKSVDDKRFGFLGVNFYQSVRYERKYSDT